MKNEKLNKSTSPADDQDNSSDVQPLAPNLSSLGAQNVNGIRIIT